MKVLLISPLPELDPPCGDVTYTETLLSAPPRGVEYVTYSAAMSEGSLREHARRASVKNERSARSIALLARESLINRARARGLLFREPFRYFEVEDAAFDLVHCHVFHCRIDTALPVVVSNGAPQPDLYSDAFGWASRRVRVAAAADRAMARGFDAHHTSLFARKADQVVCFTEYLRRWMVEHHAVEASNCTVVPVGTQQGERREARTRPFRIGFVGTDFVAKGGEVVLQAFRIAKEVRPDLELLIVGSEPRLSESDMSLLGITWLPRVSRDVLLTEHFPDMDVFAYPTNFDGPSLVLQEALACGVPAAVSDYGAMPEMVANQQAGLVSPQHDAPQLARNLLRLLEPGQHAEFRKAAASVFDDRYELTRANEKLRNVYDAARQQHG